MEKVHPDGVIWVVNSSEMLPVLRKKGSGAHIFQNNNEMFYIKEKKMFYHKTIHIRELKLGLTYSWAC